MNESLQSSIHFNPSKHNTIPYSPFVPSPMDEVVVDKAIKQRVKNHDVSEISTGRRIQVQHLPPAPAVKPATAFNRPGFDNVPSY